MKKGLFWMLVLAGLAAAVVVIKKRRSDRELEEWDSLAPGLAEKDIAGNTVDAAA